MSQKIKTISQQEYLKLKKLSRHPSITFEIENSQEGLECRQKAKEN